MAVSDNIGFSIPVCPRRIYAVPTGHTLGHFPVGFSATKTDYMRRKNQSNQLVSITSVIPDGANPARLLADAEAAENPTEQIVRVKLAGDFSECGLRCAQLFGDQFAGS